LRQKKIKFGEKVPVRLSLRERDLIIDHAFLDPELADSIKIAQIRSGNITAKYSLDDIDLLLGCIAAESNHTKNKKLQKELDDLFDRLHALMGSYIEIED
jgi:hypothetical protein